MAATIILFIIVVLCIIKTVMFFKATSRRNIKNWIFFNRHIINQSSTGAKAKAKIMQNRFSHVILTLLIADLIALLLQLIADY